MTISAWYNRGNALRYLGRYEDALKNLDRAIELNPNNDWYFYIRALIYKALKKPDEAQAELTHAIELVKAQYQENPQDWRNTFNLALYYLASDDTSNANQLYDLALSEKVPPERISEAIRDLDDFLTLLPNHVQAQTMRDLLHSVYGD